MVRILSVRGESDIKMMSRIVESQSSMTRRLRKANSKPTLSSVYVENGSFDPSARKDLSRSKLTPSIQLEIRKRAAPSSDFARILSHFRSIFKSPDAGIFHIIRLRIELGPFEGSSTIGMSCASPHVLEAVR